MLQTGTIFDSRYELVRKIGRGGFAEVWLVNDTLTGLEEALKIYAPGEGLDEDGLKIFAKELAVVHNLHHPHLLTPKMLGQYKSQPYLIMQYCPYGSLNKRVGRCTEGEAWRILEQVASGLAYLHEQGIVHQDIKPDNILIDAKLRCMIADFGISLRAQTTLRKSVRVQAISGTMAYMAPERFSAEPHPMSANDIWSLGAMMFEIIEGKVPFEEQGGGKQKSGADIPTMHADVSTNLKRVIRAMLTLKPENRPTAAKLVEVAKSKSTLPLPPEPDTDPEPPKKDPSQEDIDESSSVETKAKIIGGIVIVLIIIVVSIFGYLDKYPIGSGLNEPNPVDTIVQIKTEPDDDTEEQQRQKAEEEARRAEQARRESLKSQGWVDLGLPSGTLWKDKNESGGYYTYDEAIRKFGKRVPSKKQWEELKDKCKWTWTGDGCKVKGPNGDHIFLPAEGDCDYYGNVGYVGTYGGYWTSTPFDSESAWYMGFNSGGADIGHDFRLPAMSIRLVR